MRNKICIGQEEFTPILLERICGGGVGNVLSQNKDIFKMFILKYHPIKIKWKYKCIHEDLN